MSAEAGALSAEAGALSAEAGAKLVRAYHARTKHGLDRYARGPETLDWDAQPAPFRRFEGAPIVALPRIADLDGALFPGLHRPLSELAGVPPAAFSREALGVLFELSLGITAWKIQGPDRWAVRANPSSGNLHPVEGYALILGAAGLDAGVYHYAAEAHGLEQRALWATGPVAFPEVWIALTCIQWREAWKYGERAFRYCQLDAGHALGALSYAAAALGWRVRVESHVGSDTLGNALGLDRTADFAGGRRLETEREEPELLIALERGERRPAVDLAELRRRSESARFSGYATTIDEHPMYSWPWIEEVAAATRSADGTPCSEDGSSARWSPSVNAASRPASQVILGRRSAQRFDREFVLDGAAFARLLNAAEPGAALSSSLDAPTLDLIVFAHRVRGLAPGVYLFPRVSDAESSVVVRLRSRFELRRVRAFGDSLELLELATVSPRELARITRMLHCHQDIAATSCFSLGMLTDLDRLLRSGPSSYRAALREAGGIGQSLYLQAEAEGVRGTGIGCFFDDAVTELIGLSETPVESLYHFSIGKPVDDPRIETRSVRAFPKQDSP